MRRFANSRPVGCRWFPARTTHQDSAADSQATPGCAAFPDHLSLQGQRHFSALRAQCRQRGDQFFQIIGGTHPPPLRAYLFQTSQQEAAHIEDALDDRKRRLADV